MFSVNVSSIGVGLHGEWRMECRASAVNFLVDMSYSDTLQRVTRKEDFVLFWTIYLFNCCNDYIKFQKTNPSMSFVILPLYALYRHSLNHISKPLLYSLKLFKTVVLWLTFCCEMYSYIPNLKEQPSDKLPW